MRIGVLTGGGDCPGLNSTIRSIYYKSLKYGYEIFGFFEGWKGVIENKGKLLKLSDVEEIENIGGTILFSSRTNPFKEEKGVERIIDTLNKNNTHALVAIGGDDTLSVAAKLYEEYKIKVVGVPKTMDNDVYGTDYTFGFDSATTISMDALEKIRDTAKAMKRIIILEVMGREAGWVALFTGLAGCADLTLIPEEGLNEDEFIKKVSEIFNKKEYAVICVSEGVEVIEKEGVEVDAFGHKLLQEKGVGNYIGKIIKDRLGINTRVAQIGHVQRGGAPTLFDRILTIRLGVKAVEMIKNGEFGKMATLLNGKIDSIPLKEVLGKTKKVDGYWIDLKKVFEP
ncbi:MAG: 6-phosphofructokinase [Caldisericia bacterium]